MTLIAGYIYQGAAHLIADSAETSIGPSQEIPNDEFSSFGERNFAKEDLSVVESAQKIYNIDNKILATFAGRVGEGIKVIYDLTILHKSFQLIEDFLGKYFTQNKAFLHNEYIIAYCEYGIPYLFNYSNGKIRIVKESCTTVSGGININNIQYSIIQTIEYGSHQKYHRDDVFIHTIALLQIISLDSYALKYGVGGHFNGAYISREGVTWAKDTHYLLYSGINFGKGDRATVAKYNRGDGTFIVAHEFLVKGNEFVTKRLFQKLFYTEFVENPLENLADKWGPHVNELVKKSKSDYYVLLSYDTRTVVIINNSPNKPTRIRVKEEGLGISTEILEWMFRTYKKDAWGFVATHNLSE